MKWLLGRSKCRKLCCSPESNDRSPEDTNILTTTDWTLQRLLARRKTYQDTYSELLMVAEAAWTMPLSNCWPERGGSAIKRIKTRMRSQLTDDMLNALMHVSINGPSFGTEECTDIVQRAAEIWLSAKNRRKPRSPKESKVLIILTQPCNLTVHFFLNSDAAYCMVICSQQYGLNFAGA